MDGCLDVSRERRQGAQYFCLDISGYLGCGTEVRPVVFEIARYGIVMCSFTAGTNRCYDGCRDAQR